MAACVMATCKAWALIFLMASTVQAASECSANGACIDDEVVLAQARLHYIPGALRGPPKGTANADKEDGGDAVPVTEVEDSDVLRRYVEDVDRESPQSEPRQREPREDVDSDVLREVVDKSSSMQALMKALELVTNVVKGFRVEDVTDSGATTLSMVQALIEELGQRNKEIEALKKEQKGCEDCNQQLQDITEGLKKLSTKTANRVADEVKDVDNDTKWLDRLLGTAKGKAKHGHNHTQNATHNPEHNHTQAHAHKHKQNHTHNHTNDEHKQTHNHSDNKHNHTHNHTNNHKHNHSHNQTHKHVQNHKHNATQKPTHNASHNATHNATHKPPHNHTHHPDHNNTHNHTHNATSKPTHNATDTDKDKKHNHTQKDKDKKDDEGKDKKK